MGQEQDQIGPKRKTNKEDILKELRKKIKKNREILEKEKGVKVSSEDAEKILNGIKQHSGE